MLHHRPLGSQGLRVSALGLGCMGMSQSYGSFDDAESIATLHRAVELGVTFLDTAEVYGPFSPPFSPLGRGFLTGTAQRAEDHPEGDFRGGDPRFQGENFEANMRAADAVREIATAKAAKPGQVALAWLLHKGEDIVPITGTKRRTYLEENVAAAEVRLGDEDMKRLDEALRPEAVSGPRYNEHGMAMLDR